MLKKYFVVLAVVAVFVLVLLPIGEAVGELEAEVVSLSLQESIEMALENNPSIEIVRVAVAKAEMELKQAVRSADRMKDMLGGSYTYDVMMAERVVPLVKEMSLLLNEKRLDFAINLLDFQVESAYYDVLKAEKTMQNALDSLSRAKEQLRLAEIGLELGVKSKLDVLNAGVQAASQEVSVDYAKNNLHGKYMEFCSLVGLPIDTRIRLTSSFVFSPVDFDLEEIGQTAREKNIDYIAAHENYKVKQETFALADEYYPPNVDTYKEADFDYQTAKLELQNVDNDLDIKIAKAYFMTESAKNRYQLMEKSVEQARESYRLTKLRYEVGMATLLELENAGGELDKAEAEMLGALYDYNLSATILQHGIFAVGGASND